MRAFLLRALWRIGWLRRPVQDGQLPNREGVRTGPMSVRAARWRSQLRRAGRLRRTLPDRLVPEQPHVSRGRVQVRTELFGQGMR